MLRNAHAFGRWCLQWSLFLKHPKKLGALVLVAIAYYLGAQIAFAIGTFSDRIFAPFWPPNIVLFCTLLFVPKRQWWLYIAATFPAHVLAEIAVGMPAAQLLVAFGTNCTLAILNAVGVKWLLRQPPWFGTFWNASIYLLVTAAIGPALSAFGGAFVQILSGANIVNYWRSWGNWYLANALASVTLGPVFLIWFSRPSEAERFSRRRKVEAVILALSLGLTCAIAFRMGFGTVTTEFLPTVLYSPLPLVLWAAIRFGQRGASGAVLVITVVSIWQNLHGSTLFNDLNPERNVLALQVFLMGVAVPVFLLGAAIDELRRTGEATRELARALLQAQDEERRRIARDLHDSTGQNLVVAGLLANQVKSLAPTSCVPLIAELNDLLQRSIMEIRTATYLLHPPLLDRLGLSMALRSYVDGFSKRTGIVVELDLSPDMPPMSSTTELALFRVIQEALTNVWRHSGSSTARIRLSQQPSAAAQQVMLTIEDSGKGIPNNIRVSNLSSTKTRNHVSEGLGLASMRERLNQIGGCLEIDSVRGKTVIRAIVMLNPTSLHTTP
ncbi:MAG TPA: MASE1 domain-containing protein [Terriglobia bacterium]|nr:MASE1 domain-containing protein [Terriglobia bacterium]